MINQEQVKEQVIDNANTSSETIKNHYVISDVKKDDEVIFDFYPTSLSKKVYWEIEPDNDYYEVSDDKVFLTEKDAENSVEEFKKDPIEHYQVRDEIQDRFYDLYTIVADEDENDHIIVEDDNIETSIKKMSVSDYINEEIEKRDRYDWYGSADSNSTRFHKEKSVIEKLNQKLRRQGLNYECVRILSDNNQTFGLIKKEIIDETKKI
jgi:hypothetical protein